VFCFSGYSGTVPLYRPTERTLRAGGRVERFWYHALDALEGGPLRTRDLIETFPGDIDYKLAWWTLDGMRRERLVRLVGPATRTRWELNP
jgi:hypothetical protein